MTYSQHFFFWINIFSDFGFSNILLHSHLYKICVIFVSNFLSSFFFNTTMITSLNNTRTSFRQKCLSKKEKKNCVSKPRYTIVSLHTVRFLWVGKEKFIFIYFLLTLLMHCTYIERIGIITSYRQVFHTL